MAKQHFKSFKKGGKGLGLAKRLRLFYEEAGYHAMPIDEYRSAIRSGRYPPGTLAFAVVDNTDRKVRIVGTVVIVADDGGLAFEGDASELQGILTGLGS